MTSIINDRIEKPQAQYMSAGSSTEEDDQTESFFSDLFKTHKKVNDAEELVKKILDCPLSSSLPAADSFPCKSFKELFIKYNTPSVYFLWEKMS